MLRTRRLISVMLTATLVLSGCKTNQQRAADHYSAAKRLLQKGETRQAIVEFRNVFKLDPKSHDARIAFARLMEKRDNLPEAYAQYSQVAEQYPDDVAAIRAAARVAAKMHSWGEASRQVAAGLKLAPEDPDLLAVKAAADYAAGVDAQDEKAWQAATAAAEGMIASRPNDLLLREVVIDSLTRAGNFNGANAAADAALAQMPKEKLLYTIKLSVLSALKDNAGIEAELKKMIRLFPDDPAIGATLVRWYVTHDRLDDAEAYLRKAAQGSEAQPKLELVRFLARYHSADAALSELDKIIRATPAAAADKMRQPNTTVRTFRALRASILFDKGDHKEGITQLKSVIDGAPENDETRRLKVTLAQMDARTGDMKDARDLVDQVLSEDAGQLDAIKLKAEWLIKSDNPDDAITLLRGALDAHVNDLQVMDLMARAYERAGNHELMGDMLSQAASASNMAPKESVRYAAFLVRGKKYLAAESVLVDALRLNPGNVAILAPLGQIYVLIKDWPRATQVADQLDKIDSAEAKQASEALRPAILTGQKRVDEAVSYLHGLVAQGGNNARAADIAILRTYLTTGEVAKAQTFAKNMLAQDPTNPQLRFAAAAVQGATGDPAAAEATYRALVKEDPKRLPAWLALIGELSSSGKTNEAQATLDAALKAIPGAPDLLSLRASFLEEAGNVTGAIKIYDALYKQHSDNMVIANNLASLLAGYHGRDAANVDRAYAIARRLQGTKVPAFQDTYGWIMFLRGNAEGALSYLEPAAAALSKEPLAQYHLAEVYRALNRPKDARTEYAKVIALVNPDDTRAFVEASRSMLKGRPEPDPPTGG